MISSCHFDAPLPPCLLRTLYFSNDNMYMSAIKHSDHGESVLELRFSAGPLTRYFACAQESPLSIVWTNNFVLLAKANFFLRSFHSGVSLQHVKNRTCLRSTAPLCNTPPPTLYNNCLQFYPSRLTLWVPRVCPAPACLSGNTMLCASIAILLQM